jgi:hypothetical protein
MGMKIENRVVDGSEQTVCTVDDVEYFLFIQSMMSLTTERHESLYVFSTNDEAGDNNPLATPAAVLPAQIKLYVKGIPTVTGSISE